MARCRRWPWLRTDAADSTHTYKCQVAGLVCGVDTVVLKSIRLGQKKSKKIQKNPKTYARRETEGGHQKRAKARRARTRTHSRRSASSEHGTYRAPAAAARYAVTADKVMASEGADRDPQPPLPFFTPAPLAPWGADLMAAGGLTSAQYFPKKSGSHPPNISRNRAGHVRPISPPK